MKYVVNWIPQRIRVRSRNTQPHLKLEKPDGALLWILYQWFDENLVDNFSNELIGEYFYYL